MTVDRDDNEAVALNAYLDRRDYEQSGARAADRIAALEKRVTVDREHIRRSLERQQDEVGDPFGVCEQVLALLAELEQAEKERDEAIHGRELARLDTDNERLWASHSSERATRSEAQLAQAEKEREFTTDLLSDVAKAHAELAHRLAKVPALVEAIASALTSIATGPLKDGYAYSVLEEALAEWERTGGAGSDR